MAALHDAQVMSITAVSQRGVARLVSEAEKGSAVVLIRRQRPVAVLLGITRLAEIEEVASDLHDLALVLVRASTDTGRRMPLDDVITAFGHTRASLTELMDDE
jgi:antitoxin (DNA-binding transcriptional repressor) of toxin-antitoxin stability system